MEAEFESLEGKVAQLVSLCERLRAENADLRRELSSVQVNAKRLDERIDAAKSRLEQLLARLPD